MQLLLRDSLLNRIEVLRDLSSLVDNIFSVLVKETWCIGESVINVRDEVLELTQVDWELIVESSSALNRGSNLLELFKSLLVFSVRGCLTLTVDPVD
jgi:hypothetical protein